MRSSAHGRLPRLDSWRTQDVVEIVAESLGQGRTITYAHCETIRRSLRDPGYLDVIESLDHCYVDGVGAQIAALLSQGRWLARTTSDDFVRDLWKLAARRGLRVAMVGGQDGVTRRSTGILARAAEVNTVLVADGRIGPDGEDGLADRIAASHPDLVLLGLGQPLQERVAIGIAQRCPNAVVICVGGMFDWLRHGPCRPLWSRKIGLEWMFRLAREPRRLWRRYLLGPPETLVRIALEVLRQQTMTIPRPERQTGLTPRT